KVTVPSPTLSRVRRPPSRWAATVTPVAIAAGSSRPGSASMEERRVDTARIARIPAGIHSAIAVTRRESRSGCRITKGRARSAKVITKPIAMTAMRYPVSGMGALPPSAQQVADHQQRDEPEHPCEQGGVRHQQQREAEREARQHQRGDGAPGTAGVQRQREEQGAQRELEALDL